MVERKNSAKDSNNFDNIDECQFELELDQNCQLALNTSVEQTKSVLIGFNSFISDAMDFEQELMED
jgi:hypothetical protein